ncbi:ROK family protein [Croceibacterium sp. TMG7-5b_MA50]|uniref:ROK family protein n=1 Tax=Croceibacterium sp. TMG7-5b_MA50 TaxID=3121290 RepID=UPI0032217F3E
MSLFAAVEAGGTKFVCAVGTEQGSIEQATIPTRDVETTMSEVEAFFTAASERHGSFAAIGIGSFGPLQLDRRLPGYGRITTTPKPGWSGVDLPHRLGSRFDVPVAIDTDVNVAALAEARQRDCGRLAYVTVGTGIGVGFAVAGRTSAGYGHPEIGHIRVRQPTGLGEFAGVCPYHGDCLEGIASGPAIQARWGISLTGLPLDHPAWTAQASALGELASLLILSLVPDAVVFGGGVMQQERLFPLIRAAAAKSLGGYVPDASEEALQSRILPPACAEPPGLVGAFLLARAAAMQA